MWSSVDDQIALYDGFAADLKANTKEVKTLIRQFHKPPKATKKAKTAASEGEKKRGRKKKDVTEEQDPILALNERLVAAAQSDEPIVNAPEYVRSPKTPEAQEEIKTPEALTQEEPAKPAKKKAAAAKTEDKEAVKAAEKAAKEAVKAAEKAAKETEKAAEKAEKEAAKAIKEAEKLEKEATKALKEAEKAEKAAAKAVKDANKAAKPVKEPKNKVDVVLPIPALVRSSPASIADDEEEEELECEVFPFEGVEYLIDTSNTVYDRNTQYIIGTYDSTNKKIIKR
jgi:hypothetical protein